MKILTTVLALLLLAGPAYAADTAAGKVTYTKGDVSLYQTGRSAPTPLAKGDPVFAGDEIETGKSSAITVTFADDSVLSMGQNGKIIIDQYQFDGKTPKKVRLSALRAAFEWLGGAKEVKDTEITIDFGAIGIRGTHIIRGMKDGQCTVYVQDGQVVVKNDGGKVELAAGQGTTINGKTSKPADAASMNAEQIAWIRAELPAPVTPWEAINAAAPVPQEPVPTARQPETAPAPIEVPPVRSPEIPPAIPAPEAPAPVVTPEPIPMPTPVPAPEQPAPAPALSP
jgi:hypothetical protein